MDCGYRGIPQNLVTVLQQRSKCFFSWQTLSQLLISCACVLLSLMSIYPILVHKLSLLFSLFKIKAPDTRSLPAWVISQPLTFPSLKQAPARTLIDPADGLGANLPGDRQEVTVFHCSIWCNYPQNKHILDSSWPSDERGWVGGLFVHLNMSVWLQLFINQADITNKTYPEHGVTEESGLLAMKLLFLLNLQCPARLNVHNAISPAAFPLLIS